MLQGDGVPIKKLASAVTSESEERMMVPWTAGAGRSTNREAALCVDLQKLHALDDSDECEEVLPYCVMPHVERLLQVSN